MFGKSKDTPINSEQVLADLEKQPDFGDAGLPNLGSTRRSLPAGAKAFLLIVVFIAVSISCAFGWHSWKKHQERVAAEAEEKANGGKGKPKQDPATVGNNLAPLNKPAPTPIQRNEPAPAPKADIYAGGDKAIALKDGQSQQAGQSNQPPVKTKEQIEKETKQRLLDRRRGKKDAATQDLTQATEPARPKAGSTGGSLGGGEGEFQRKLQPIKLEAAAAAIVGDRNFLLTQGTPMDCTLDTMMITTQPGQVVCFTTRDLFSANHRVKLVEKNSKVVGFYQGGMKQGEARIFVLWTRIETANGVVIQLDSPGTGPLGEAGVGGVIDSHFMERFGGALLTSIVGDLGQYAANKGQSGSSGNNTTLQFSNTANGTTQAATEIIKNSINIPPTLYKNQGERVSISIARDLDFGGVYELEAR